jgi:hypothetical protein
MAVAQRDVAESSRTLRRVLGDVRRRIRAYVLVEGLGLTIATAGIGLWMALGLDRLFEPVRWVRLAFLSVVIAATAYVFVRKVLARVFVRFADTSLAMVVERRFRGLDESLLTAVELEASDLPVISRTLLSATRSRAAEALGTANVDRVFNPLPRRRAVAAAVGLAATVGAFALAAPDLFRLGISRLTAQTDELWPRRTGLSVEGFENGERVVAVGSDVELIVRADTKKVVPSRVDVYYRSDNGERDQAIMDKIGEAGAADEFQPYKTIFNGVASTLTLDVYGGDARLRNLKLRVVERPQVSLRLWCDYPDYTRRESGWLDVTGTMPLPQGTLVSVHAECQKRLRRATIGRPDGAGGTKVQLISLAGDADSVKFQFELGALMFDTQVTIDLDDVDGIDNRANLMLQAVADIPPAVNVARKAIETSVTANARVPMVGKISDDYGLERLWFEYSVEGSESREIAFAKQPDGAREAIVDEALELPSLFPSPTPLVPGQKLAIIPRAVDGRSLPEQPKGNLTPGEATTLDVVTDAAMRRLLEAREIMLGKQFKTLIDKVTRDRDSLVAIGAKEEKSAQKPADDGETTIPRDQIVADQARSHTKENRAETLAVADGFAKVVEEIINNRIESSETWHTQLSEEVATPLRNIGENLFPQYEAKLTELQLAVARKNDPAGLEAARAAASKSADEIIVAMNVVLKKMRELESFKEAVDLLRSIIAMHKGVEEQTKKHRSSKARLLE